MSENINIDEWLRHIDQKFDKHSEQNSRNQEKLESKLDDIHLSLNGKADKERVEAIAKRVRHTEIKQAGIATTVSAIMLWFKSHILPNG